MNTPTPDLRDLAGQIKGWAAELGFSACGITNVDIGTDEANLLSWLAHGHHGEMGYMARHGSKRTRPAELLPGTVRVLSLRMDYWPPHVADAHKMLAEPDIGYVSRYALGRDYHKTIRKRLQRLADRIDAHVGEWSYRAFVDSAPVMEKPLARNAGLGWIGKHTNLINSQSGSWFFLGELFTNLPLPVDAAATDHCGTCHACIDACPTGAIIAPYQLDARLCIAYLTIELRGSIPVELRPLIGNRIFGCDDCQLVCPWNKFSTPSTEADFAPRHGLDGAQLTHLLSWTKAEFERHTEGSAIRRIGHECWLRNVAVALGNAPASPAVSQALQARYDDPSPLVREHVRWALTHQQQRGRNN